MTKSSNDNEAMNNILIDLPEDIAKEEEVVCKICMVELQEGVEDTLKMECNCKGEKRYAWISATVQFILVVGFAHAFYSKGEGEGGECWLKFSLNLPSKPRSPILVNGLIIELCDVGSLWRSQWKLFICGLKDFEDESTIEYVGET
ncbi:SKP1-interacting partner 15 [Artemisia annua]|uniref:SKP1-interacting partner 15 n=1 Tax=Artemisia annua TaxID=35608 RepID=A0A2U1N559_ARTAN|nr:SKP1-interacting partner 15 [Artemisia annua]